MRALPTTVAPGTFARAYRNLTVRDRVSYSVQDRGGVVVAHVTSLRLRGVNFRVREGGRRRVLATHQRNVHAFAEGTVRPRAPSGEWVQLHYDPYRCGAFTTGAGVPVASAAWARLDASGLWVLEPVKATRKEARRG